MRHKHCKWQNANCKFEFAFCNSFRMEDGMDASSRLDPLEPMQNGSIPHPIISSGERGERKPVWKPLDLHGLKTYDLKARPSKVFHEDLGRPAPSVNGSIRCR